MYYTSHKVKFNRRFAYRNNIAFLLSVENPQPIFRISAYKRTNTVRIKIIRVHVRKCTKLEKNIIPKQCIDIIVYNINTSYKHPHRQLMRTIIL